MSETTGIQIPDSIENKEFYNNHEWGMILKFRTSKKIFEKFCKANNMSRLHLDDLEMRLLNDIEKISLDEKLIKFPSNYLIFTDCKTGNSWTLLAHKNSRTIWLEVLYPDNNGDITLCRKKSVANKMYN